MNASISIGMLARQTGCTVPTIRYYEEIGLLPAGPRTETGQRIYSEPAVRRLTSFAAAGTSDSRLSKCANL